MDIPSLGEILRARGSCETADCIRELERKAADKGSCAERDLELVQDFFHSSMVQFTNCILARTDVRPVVIGKNQNVSIASILQSFRWTEDFDIADESHPYHGVWKTFRTWCEENELRPMLHLHRDTSGKERWHTLTVTAAPKSPVRDSRPGAASANDQKALQ